MTPEQAIEEANTGKLRPVYLVTGEEPYLEAQVLTALKRAALVGAVPGLNDDQLHAGEVEVDRVISAARTLPMMAKRRLVLVRGLERWEPKEGRETKGKEPFDRLLEYAKDPVPSTVLLLTGNALDKRRRFMVAARNEGYLVSCDALPRNELPRWVEREARARGVRIGMELADLVAELAGPELSQVADAVERLSLYAGEGAEIDEDAIAATVVRLRPSTVWELVGAVGRRDLGSALAALDRVYDPADRGLRLLGVLAWSTRQLIRFDAATREGLSPGDAAARAGAPPFKARELAQQVRGFRPAELERWLVELALLDANLKGGSKRPAKASLELTIERLCAAEAWERAPQRRPNP